MLLKDKLLNLPRPAMKMTTVDFKKKIPTNKKFLIQSHSVIDVHNKKKAPKDKSQIPTAEQFKNEKNLGKKIELALNIIDTFLSPEPNFKANWDIVKELFENIKQELTTLGGKTKEHYGSDNNYQKLQDEYKNISKNLSEAVINNSRLEKKIADLNKENKLLKLKITRNWDFFKSLQEAGIPIHNLYDNYLHNSTRSKSAEKLQHKDKPGEENEDFRGKIRENITHEDVPRLKIDVRNIEGYQEEFMNMFQEFSESWRNQITNELGFLGKGRKENPPDL
jgi:predicted RNase H-like nuclease (RuvC/YqgF family)